MFKFWISRSAPPAVAASALALLLFFPIDPGKSTRAQTTKEPASSDLVVYSTLQPYNLDIFLRERRGGPLKRLTTDQANDYNPIFSPDGRRVLFCSERRGNPDLYALDLIAGGPPRPLTANTSMDDAPSISRDGSQLAFVSDRHGNADIFVMPFDPDDPAGDSRAVNITNHSAGDFNPAFSPDGRSIAFSSNRDLPTTDPEFWRKSGGSEIYIMDSDGTNARRLTNAKGWDGSPAWSIDGKVIYFYSERDGAMRIWRMNANGTAQRPVSPKEIGNAVAPATGPGGRVAFSSEGNIYSLTGDGDDLKEEVPAGPALSAPDFDNKTGKMVAHGDGPVENRVLRSNGRPFAATGTANVVSLPDRRLELRGIYPGFPSLSPGAERVAATQTDSEYGNVLIVVSKLDGTDSRTIFKSEGQIFSNIWSPTGEWIAIAEGQPFAPESVRSDIWRFRPDGSEAKRLTGSTANNAFPDFSGDGKRIVFRSGRDGNKEIYLMEADGSNPRRLTENNFIDTMPAISPDGFWVAYSSDEYALKGTADFDIFILQLDQSGMPGASRPGWIPGKSAFTSNIGPDMHPRFSPDGAWIVFSSSRGGFNDEAPLFDAGPQPYGELWAKPVPWGPAIRLTHNKWEDSLPDWGKKPNEHP